MARTVNWRRIAMVVSALSALVVILVILAPYAKNRWSTGDGPSSGLVCAEPIADFGSSGALRLSHAFVVRNSLNRTLRIQKVGRTCGCLDVHMDKPVLGPAESMEVRGSIEVRPRKKDARTRFAHRIVLHCSDPDLPPLQLHFVGEYVPPAYSLPQHVSIAAPSRVGAAYHGQVEVFVNSVDGVGVTKCALEGSIQGDLTMGAGEPLGDGYTRIPITIDGHLEEGSVLPSLGHLVVSTSSSDLPALQIPVVLVQNQRESASIAPHRLALGVVQAGNVADGTITVSCPKDLPCEVDRVECEDPRVTWAILPVRESGDRRTIPMKCEFSATGKVGVMEANLAIHLVFPDHKECHEVVVSGYVKAQSHDTREP